MERAPRCAYVAYAYIRPCPHCRRVSKASGMKMLGICHDTLWDLKIFRFSASSATCYWPLNSARLCHIGWSHCIQLSTRQVTIPFFFWIWKVSTGFCFIFIWLENDFFELNVSPPSICWAFNELPHGTGTHLQPVWVTHAGAIQARRWMTSVTYPPRAGWTGKSTIRGQKLRILEGLSSHQS